MNDDDLQRGPRPIPVTDAIRDLIRKTATDRPTEIPAPPARTFHVDNVEWIARVTGEGSGGTGALGPAPFVAIRFFRSDEPSRPRREALLPRGAFENLYDTELVELFHRARTIEADKRDSHD